MPVTCLSREMLHPLTGSGGHLEWPLFGRTYLEAVERVMT